MRTMQTPPDPRSGAAHLERIDEGVEHLLGGRVVRSERDPGVPANSAEQVRLSQNSEIQHVLQNVFLFVCNVNRKQHTT